MTSRTKSPSSIAEKESYEDKKCDQLATNHLKQELLCEMSTIFRPYNKILKLTIRMNISKPWRTKLRHSKRPYYHG